MVIHQTNNEFRAAPRRNWADPLQSRRISRSLKGKAMLCSNFQSSYSSDVIALFTQVFIDSEGDSEGEAIGQLVTEMIDTTPALDLIGFVAHDEQQQLIGAIFFSRLGFDDQRSGFILSPVAIATANQKQGVGQTLINYGLDQLRQKQVEVVLTYGDPNYYTKVGFAQISEELIAAPQTLSHPQGWLAQSLTEAPIESTKQAVSCIPALDQAKYW